MKKNFNEIDEVNAVLHSNISNLESKKVALKSSFDQEEQRKRAELEPEIRHMIEQIAQAKEEFEDGEKSIAKQIQEN